MSFEDKEAAYKLLANPGCSKCYGTGRKGFQRTHDDKLCPVVCPCVHKNFIRLAKEHKDSLPESATELEVAQLLVDARDKKTKAETDKF